MLGGGRGLLCVIPSADMFTVAMADFCRILVTNDERIQVYRYIEQHQAWDRSVACVRKGLARRPRQQLQVATTQPAGGLHH